MHKILKFFSIIIFSFSFTITNISCGVEDGKIIKINIKNEPLNDNNSDPLINYVSNKYYKFDKKFLYYSLVAFMQLASDKIKIDRYELEKLPYAKNFYNSDSYKSGNYESINYNLNDDINKIIKEPFAFKDSKDNFLILSLTDNDILKQKYFIYWYIVYDTPEKAENPSKNDKICINYPEINDFNNNKKNITKKGWIHLFFTMNDLKSNKKFKIDFNIQIDINFILYFDKNKKPIVLIDTSTFYKSLGNFDFRHPENTIHERINNIKFLEL